MQHRSNVLYSPSKRLALDWYMPESGGDAVVYFHGGGLENGKKEDAALLAENAVRRGLGFLSADYRMYPDAKFPDFVLDAAEAVAFAQASAADYGGSGRVIAAGSSAGAYLVMLMALNPAYLINAGADPGKIIAWVSDSAQQTTHFRVLKERGLDGRAERIDEAAPLYFVGMQKLLSPLLLISYADDIACRGEQNDLLYKSLLRFQKDAPVSRMTLPGAHCEGDWKINGDGEYPLIAELARFYQERRLG